MDIRICIGQPQTKKNVESEGLTPRGRRGRIPEHAYRPELASVTLCLRGEASPFWIILLLVLADLETGHKPPCTPSRLPNLARAARGP
jgi:hypothetical protein